MTLYGLYIRLWLKKLWSNEYCVDPRLNQSQAKINLSTFLLTFPECILLNDILAMALHQKQEFNEKAIRLTLLFTLFLD